MSLRRITSALSVVAVVAVVAVLALGGCSLTEEGASFASPIVLMQVNDAKVSVDESGRQITLTVAFANCGDRFIEVSDKLEDAFGVPTVRLRVLGERTDICPFFHPQPFDVAVSVAPVLDVVRIERADAPDIVLDLRVQPD